MGAEPIRWEGTDTDRKPSASIWGRCPWSSILDGSVNGAYVWDDFSSFNVTPATTEGNWAANRGYAQFSSAGGFITAPAITAATTSGVGQTGITIGSDDDNEGVGIRTLSTPFVINRSTQKLWFECRLKKSTIANTTFELFAGFMENAALTAIVPITTTAATLADKNLFGFYSTESAGANASVSYKCDGVAQVNVSTTEVTFVADTYTKLGIKYELTGDKDGQYILSFYQDGVRLATSKQVPTAAGTDFPNDIAMGLVLATRNAAGTSPGNATISWWRAAQLYAPLN